MDFRLLGALEVQVADAPVQLPAAKHRIVLASLLVRHNRVVSTDELYERVWDGDPPRGAKKTLQGYVARLRRNLGADLIETRPHGYLIRFPPAQLDVVQFHSLLEEAERVRSEPERVAAILRRALGLWRGEALADVPSDLLQRTEATGLAEQRLHVLEWRAEVDLALGRHASLIPELRELVSLHPHRERLWCHLLLALHQSGRQADALDAYRRARALLVEELGIEPGRELQQLHQRILVGDRHPAGAVAIPVTGDSARTVAGWHPFERVVPAEVPPAIADFTGRRVAARALSKLLLAGRSVADRPATTVAVIGPGGVGKSALAVQVAHRVGDRFADGQLYADLGAGGERADPRDVLAHFLRALGVPADQTPDSVEERSARYRSRTAGRSILVVLDHAADEAQTRPLIPSGAPSAMLITARVAPVGLEGLRQLRLDLFDRDEALGLLAAIVGPDRLRAEPVAAQAIVDYCCGLPLALRIAGVRLASRPHARLSWLADRLASEQRRLDELAVGDLDLRRSLAAGGDALPQQARRAWQMLGLSDQPELDGAMVATQLRVPEAEARELLDVLVEHQLLEVVDGWDGPARYVTHELQWLQVREQVRAESGCGAPVPAGAARPAGRSGDPGAPLTDHRHTTGSGKAGHRPADRLRTGWTEQAGPLCSGSVAGLPSPGARIGREQGTSPFRR
jgi:DNA-binding SARP family transcriptional activator